MTWEGAIELRALLQRELDDPKRHRAALSCSVPRREAGAVTMAGRLTFIAWLCDGNSLLSPRSFWPKVLLSTAGCAALLGWGQSAWSAPAADQLTTARELFDHGRKLKFEESQRLDPGGGTILNLALCNELVGKTATAWVQFRDGLRSLRILRRSSGIW